MLLTPDFHSTFWMNSIISPCLLFNSYIKNPKLFFNDEKLTFHPYFLKLDIQ